MIDPDRLAEFLSRYRIDGEPLSAEQAHAAAERIREVTDLSAGELTARGYRYLTVAHGDIDTAEDEAAVHQLWSWADRHPGAIAQTCGTNDTTTWLFTPTDADTHLAALEAVAQEHNPGWWRIRRSAR